MAVTKPKDMPPFWVFSIFGQSYDNYRHAERLFRLIQEIGFKRSAVSIAINLISEQEKTIQGLHRDTVPRGRSYEPEVKQMAYLGFFLDAVYALTEKISHVTKIYYNNLLRDGFNSQRNDFLKRPQLDSSMANLLRELDWYDLFREIRIEHSHYGTSILAFGYDKEDPQTGSSQLIIEIAGKEKKRALVGERYLFDLKKIKELQRGIDKFIQQWSLILLRKLDEKTTLSGKQNQKNELTLKSFMEDRI